MIYIENAQKLVPLDVRAVERDLHIVLEHLGYADFDVSVLFTDNMGIQSYNKQFRNKDMPTDVLSFPYHTDAAPDTRIVAKTEDDKNLGDIIISTEYVHDDAPRWSQTTQERIQVLLVHAVCHLLGYDHVTDEDYKCMHAKETELLSLLTKTL